MKKILVWHRRDLRVEDNPALLKACEDGYPLPVYIVDPANFERESPYCKDRLNFLIESLKDLDNQYKKLGSSLSILIGNPEEKLHYLMKKYSAELYFNEQTTRWPELARDEKIKRYEGVTAFSDDGIKRDEDSRKWWYQHCEEYLTSLPLRAPDEMPENMVPSEATPERVARRYGIRMEKFRVPKGGTRFAKRKLNTFIDSIEKYPQDFWKEDPFGNNVSRLSPYLSLGCVSLRMVYREVDKCSQLTKLFYLKKLFWNRHMCQKMQDYPDMYRYSVNPVFDEYVDAIYKPNRDILDAWKKGLTGFPLVDASARALLKTGYLSYPLRVLLATFLVFILKQHWKDGADFMGYHLIDGDDALNYSWWQCISGVVGAYDNLVIDPTTRSDSVYNSFVGEYVSELKGLSDEYLMVPWKSPATELARAGVRLGSSYPHPIVDFEKEFQDAVRIYKELNKKAISKLREEVILKRASLYGVEKKRVKDARLPRVILF